jgi:hypothetical protein
VTFDSDSTDSERPVAPRFQFGLSTVMLVTAVLALLFAFPGVLPLLWTLLGPLLVVLIGFASLLLVQFTILLFFRGLLGRAKSEEAEE